MQGGDWRKATWRGSYERRRRRGAWRRGYKRRRRGTWKGSNKGGGGGGDLKGGGLEGVVMKGGGRLERREAWKGGGGGWKEKEGDLVVIKGGGGVWKEEEGDLKGGLKGGGGGLEGRGGKGGMKGGGRGERGVKGLEECVLGFGCPLPSWTTWVFIGVRRLCSACCHPSTFPMLSSSSVWPVLLGRFCCQYHWTSLHVYDWLVGRQIYLNGWLKMTSSCWEAGGALSPAGHVLDISAPKLYKYSRMPWGFLTCQLLSYFLGVGVCFCVTFVVVLHHVRHLEWAWIYTTQVPFWLIGWLIPPPPPSTTQSCQASVRMEELLLQSQKDPMTSRLAALLHQRQSLLRDHLSTNLGRSTLFASITSSLEKDWQVSSSCPPPPPSLLNLVSIPEGDPARFLSLALGIKSSYALGTSAFKNRCEDPSV